MISVFDSTPKTLFTVDRWVVRELVLTWPKVTQLWNDMQAYKTLFSDLTRGDFNNFLRLVTQPNTVWFEVMEGEKTIGVLWLSDLELMIDANAHMVFFDRKPQEKVGVCKELIRWAFSNIPLQRISVELPIIYYATIRLVEKLGFKYEGTRRRSVLIGGWKDVKMFGILREEVS